MEPTEDIWGRILSQKEDVVSNILKILSDEEKEDIVNHLYRMTSEVGWHPDQIISAQFALKIFQQEKKK